MDIVLLFLPELLGTFVGAMLGLGAAMWWDRHKEAQATVERKRLVLESLLEELDSLSGVLEEASALKSGVPAPQDVENDKPLRFSWVALFWPTSAFQSAIQSGGLSLLPPKLQASLSTVYEAIRITRTHADHLTISYAARQTVKDTADFIRNAENYLRSMAGFALDTLKDVQAELLEEQERTQNESARS